MAAPAAIAGWAARAMRCAPGAAGTAALCGHCFHPSIWHPPPGRHPSPQLKPKRAVRQSRPRATLTQGELLAEAANTEIENTRSLQVLQLIEEETRKKATADKKKYVGPMVRFLSRAQDGQELVSAQGVGGGAKGGGCGALGASGCVAVDTRASGPGTFGERGGLDRTVGIPLHIACGPCRRWGREVLLPAIRLPSPTSEPAPTTDLTCHPALLTAPADHPGGAQHAHATGAAAVRGATAGAAAAVRDHRPASQVSRSPDQAALCQPGSFPGTHPSQAAGDDCCPPGSRANRAGSDGSGAHAAAGRTAAAAAACRAAGAAAVVVWVCIGWVPSSLPRVLHYLQ